MKSGGKEPREDKPLGKQFRKHRELLPGMGARAEERTARRKRGGEGGGGGGGGGGWGGGGGGGGGVEQENKVKEKEGK